MTVTDLSLREPRAGRERSAPRRDGALVIGLNAAGWASSSWP